MAAGQEPEPDQGAAEKRQSGLCGRGRNRPAKAPGLLRQSVSIGEASFLVVSFDPFELVAALVRQAALVQIAGTSKYSLLLRRADFRSEAPHTRLQVQLRLERPDVPV